MKWRPTRWLRAILHWSEDHPVPGAIGLFFATLIGLISFAQGVD
jgi:hypothetical protein